MGADYPGYWGILDSFFFIEAKDQNRKIIIKIDKKRKKFCAFFCFNKTIIGYKRM